MAREESAVTAAVAEMAAPTVVTEGRAGWVSEIDEDDFVVIMSA